MKTSNKKKLLVIGAGWEQLELIKEAKAQGHVVIATHPVMNTDGFEIADRFFVKDSVDIKSHLEIAKTYDIDGVITDNCDFSYYTASIVAHSLNLKFGTVKSALLSNNKFSQRQICKQSGILQPDFNLVTTPEELEASVSNLGFPIILKPVDSRGTFGVTIVKDNSNLKQAFLDAISNSSSRRIIVEKFISGTLITVDGFCFNNGHKALTMASRVFEDGTKPITKEIVYPGELDKNLKKRTLINHEKVVAALGYNYGHSHGEYIIDENEDIYLVECTNRGGGVYTSSTIVPELTDINLNKILINQSLGIDDFKIHDLNNEYMVKSIILTFLDFEVGKVLKSINTNVLIDLPYVIKYKTIYGENDMVESIDNCASRHSMLVIEGKDVQESYKNLEEFKSTLNIEYYKL